MADSTRGGLRTIFSFFLGLMLTGFVGVGVYTFHPPPDQFSDELRDLSRREQAIRTARAPNDLTSADRDSIQTIERRRNQLTDAAAAARVPWSRSTSITLIVFATILMVVSLTTADHAAVISNGLLLGGVFTMLYGVGWLIATDTSISRFVAVTVALVITIGIGWMRFVRRRPMSAAPQMSGSVDRSGYDDMERRVHDLEQRLNDAASALGSRSRRENH